MWRAVSARRISRRWPRSWSARRGARAPAARRRRRARARCPLDPAAGRELRAGGAPGPGPGPDGEVRWTWRPRSSRVGRICPDASANEVWFDATLLGLEPVTGGSPGSGLSGAAAPAGERMVPFGGMEAVRLTKLLAVAGVPRHARARWPVVALGSEALWLLGVRRGAAAPLTGDDADDAPPPWRRRRGPLAFRTATPYDTAPAPPGSSKRSSPPTRRRRGLACTLPSCPAPASRPRPPASFAPPFRPSPRRARRRRRARGPRLREDGARWSL